MSTLIRRADRSPMRRMGLWGDDLDRVMEGFFRPLGWPEEAASVDLVPAMDVIEREDAFIVKTEMPGVKKDDIKITTEDGVLTISAETRSETEEKKEGRVIRQERRYGKYVRSLRLGTGVDSRNVKASYKDGILELTLPKAEEAKPKKISVSVD
jgi:HSP20 family protein